MAVTYTENYKLGKQENHADKFDMAVITENMDKIDKALSEKVDAEKGKGLLTEDERKKLSGLENYNDTEIKTEIALNRDTVGYQRKNLLDVKSESKTISGITYTVNPDNSITANGTATSNAIFEFSSNVVLPTEKLAFTGNPVGASDSTFRLYLMRSNFTGTTEAGASNDVFFTPQANMSYLFRIVVYSGQTVDNLTFYPMLRKADITDSTYVPYQPTVAEQLAEIRERLAALERTAL